jgi:hypothetical protein
VHQQGNIIWIATKPEILMAHIIQGIEAKAIRAAIELYPSFRLWLTLFRLYIQIRRFT